MNDPKAQAAICEAPAKGGADALDAARSACRALCDGGSVRHCQILSAVCQSGIPGGLLCPAEGAWALERACTLGAAASCAAAAAILRQGSRGVRADPAKAAFLMKRACTLDLSQCPGVSEAEAQAALGKLTAVKVPGGTFRPGFRPYDTEDKPQGFRLPPVTLGPFDVDRTEVTVGAYAACVNAGKCLQPRKGGACNWGQAGRLGHPMNCVSPAEAEAFCAWRGRRLPNQDEWELSARGTDDRIYPWGNTPPGDQLCWNTETTCPVDAYPQGQSPYGVLDMEGNLQEWTTSTAYVTNVATFFTARVARGASYRDTSVSRMGLNNQHYHRPTDSSPWVGFRCVSLGGTRDKTDGEKTEGRQSP